MKRQPGVEALFQSRSLLENTLRTLATEQIKNLTIAANQDVVGLVQEPASARVCGVRVRDHADGGERVVEADLVVDASGRSSRSIAWLEELGQGRPDETIVDAHCGYASRWYAAPKALPAGGGGGVPPTWLPARRIRWADRWRRWRGGGGWSQHGVMKAIIRRRM